MTTTRQRTVSSQIVLTNSSPGITDAWLNEQVALNSSTPKHSSAKRLYPFWRTCPICSTHFGVMDNDGVHKKHFCSQLCATESASQKRRGRTFKQSNPRQKKESPTKREFICANPDCLKAFQDFPSQHNGKSVYCSHSCRAKHATAPLLQARNAANPVRWTEERKRLASAEMTGEKNHAWKGGVTYFRKHGNYATIKYVRCPSEYIDMARKDGYVMEHRLFVAQALGRCLTRAEVVHHVNHAPKDNSLSNLQLFASNQAHKLFEHHGTPLPVWPL